MKHAVMIDFGSTFTKVVVADVQNRKLLLTDKVPSTVGTDAGRGMEECFRRVRDVLGEQAFDEALKLTSSSAAGGLRMAVIGLTRSLSTLAGKSAALGAGAKIVANYNGGMTEDDGEKLAESDADIVLLSGGYEHGNLQLVLDNARTLARSRIRVPVIYSGNSELGVTVRTLMKAHQKKCFIIDNIIPAIGELNVEPVQEVIRNLFLDRITDMKGFHEVKQYFDNSFIPTPAAVLSAGELLNRGPGGRDGFGSFLLVDVGGATTDVYSFSENKSCRGAKLIGVEEPFAKRTVEGDLGMRESSGGVLNEEVIGRAAAELGCSVSVLQQSVEKRMEHIDYLPDTEEEYDVDDKIASLAVEQAVARHSGVLRPSYNKVTPWVQLGKNLTEIRRIIGTGGVLVHNRDPRSILKAAEGCGRDEKRLVPRELKAYLDADYVFFAAGLLREYDEEAAYELMINSLTEL